MARPSSSSLPIWIFWAVATVVSGLFVILCLVAFVDMAQIQYEALAGRPASAINGALAGTLMSAILLTLLAITSFMILVRKTWSQSGTGFSYGFVDAAYLFMSFFSLLTGVVLTAAKHMTTGWENSPLWGTSATNAYVATYIFAFLTSGTFLVTFLALILYRRAVQNKELTMDDLEARLRAPSAQMTSIAGAPASPRAAGGLGTSRSEGAWRTTSV